MAVDSLRQNDTLLLYIRRYCWMINLTFPNVYNNYMTFWNKEQLLERKKKKATKVIPVGKCVKRANAKRNITKIYYKISEKIVFYEEQF